MTDKSMLDTLRAHSYEVEASSDAFDARSGRDPAAFVFDDFLPKSRNRYGAFLILAAAGVPVLTLALLWSLVPSASHAPARPPAANALSARNGDPATPSVAAILDALNVQHGPDIGMDAKAATPQQPSPVVAPAPLRSQALSVEAPSVAPPEKPVALATRSEPPTPSAPPLPEAAPRSLAPALSSVATAAPAAKAEELASIPSAPPSRSDETTPIAARPATPPQPALSAQAKALRLRGDELMGMGDVASARLFYERAADAGDGHAALLAGHTYNPAILSAFGVKGMNGDMAEAEKWPTRAWAHGDKDAARELTDVPPPGRTH